MSLLTFLLSLLCPHVLPPTVAGVGNAVYETSAGELLIFLPHLPWSGRDPMLCRKNLPREVSSFYMWEVISILNLLWQKLFGGRFYGHTLCMTVCSICLHNSCRQCEQKRWGGTADLFKGIAKARKYSSEIHFKRPSSDLALHQCLCMS